MVFDLSNELQRNQFDSKCEYYKKRNKVVELKIRSVSKSYPQLKYLHVLLRYVGCECGCDSEYVKEHYFKVAANKDIFVSEVDDKYTGRAEIVLKSCASLTKEEMSDAIERFRNWASMTVGIYLPQPYEEDMLREAEMEIERNKYYL